MLTTSIYWNQSFAVGYFDQFSFYKAIAVSMSFIHMYAFEEKCSSSLAMDIIYAEVISPRLAYQHPLLYKQNENC
jgi:hypothetical protein